MQWILQEFEDTIKLGSTLDRLGIDYSFHKVVPFIGELDPEPIIKNKNNVVLFGSYTLWRYAEKKQLLPGVFRIDPFVHQKPWQPFLINGKDSLFLKLKEIPDNFPKEDRDWFMRPVSDSKEQAGQVLPSSEIFEIANSVLSLKENEIIKGSLSYDTLLMFSDPVKILKEWRLWIVNNKLVTYSLYKEGKRVVYRNEIDQDVADFANDMIMKNPNYSPAYVLDICRTNDGLKIIETNCINAAGMYASDIYKLVEAIETMQT